MIKYLQTASSVCLNSRSRYNNIWAELPVIYMKNDKNNFEREGLDRPGEL